MLLHPPMINIRRRTPDASRTVTPIGTEDQTIRDFGDNRRGRALLAVPFE
jgi:hypothetical protein